MKVEPFEARNVVATYIGVGVFVILYAGYTLYEIFALKTTKPHFVPLLEADLDTNAVWGPGEGEQKKADTAASAADPPAALWRRIVRRAY